MKILAIDFSAAERSAAAWDGVKFGEATATGEKATNAFSLIERALEQAGMPREAVEVLAVGLGPGSYTGIRAAIAVAQGWQLARPVRLLGVSDADVIAAQAQANGIRGPVAVAVDAQRGEFYLALYVLDEAGWRETEPLRITSPAEIERRQARGAILVGPGISQWFSGGRAIFPRAATLARLAAARSDFVAGEALQPIYLREATFLKAPPPRVLPAGL